MAVLLIDSDLGFLFWLGRALDQAGYDAYPSRNVADATTLLAELQLKVNALILNYDLPGAQEFIATLRQTRPHLKVISLSDSSEEPAPLLPGVDAVCYRPTEINERSKNGLVQLVHKVLSLNSLAF